MAAESVQPVHSPLLHVVGLRKRFGPVEVLHEIDLELYEGEVVALLGPNGAGKSTLVKILCGELAKDGGTIALRGQPIELASPRQALHAGIRILPQEVHIVPELSVAENIFLSDLPTTRRWRLLPVVNRRALIEGATTLVAQLGLDVDVRRPAGSFPLAQQRIFEIARVLTGPARILFLDEPTASLTGQEVSLLFQTLERLRAEGVAIVMITHRVDEAVQFADRIVVLRDGRVVGVYQARNTSPREVVQAMVGEVGISSALITEKHKAGGIPLLAVKRLSVTNVLSDISFEVHVGEIVGLFGLVGSGVEFIGRALLGTRADGQVSGQVRLGQELLPHRSPGSMIRRGIGYVPADRHREGLVLDLSVAANITLPILRRYVGPFGFLRRSAEEQSARRWQEQLAIRTRHLQQRIRWLSGGNQQKVLLARWLEADARLLILEEPTRGVDVRARQEIHRAILERAHAGTGMLVISTDAEEIATLCDRVHVIARGQMVATYQRGVKPEELMHAAAYSGERTATR